MHSLNRFVRTLLPLWLVAPLLGLILVCGLGGGFVAARATASPASCPDTQEVCEEFAVFWQVWQLAKDNYVDTTAINTEHMTEGAVEGMLDSLGDQGHTRFLSAEEAQAWGESLRGSFEGIGAYIDIRDNYPIIVAPIEGSPAEAAGILAGDTIVAVDGESTENWTTEELVSKVRGPDGTSVLLSIIHPGETTPVDITVKRAEVSVPSVSWRMLPNDVAMVRLNSFSQGSGDELRRALVAAQDQGARALIFDLRNNPGGFLNEAVSIGSEFLPEGTTLLIEEDRADDRNFTKAVSGGVALDIPMVVLVNANTASSAEIVSGAIQAAGRGEVIGQRTFGTGTVLNTFNLEGGAQLLLGTEQWLTPDGRLIREEGIAPNIEVALDPEVQIITPNEAEKLSKQELLESTDAQLARAYSEVEATVGQQGQ